MSNADGSNEPPKEKTEEEKQAEARKFEMEMRRSNVRRWVTYISIWGYVGLASLVVVWLMWAGRYEVAIGVLGGVAGLAGSITGFWFGSRRTPSGNEGGG